MRCASQNARDGADELRGDVENDLATRRQPSPCQRDGHSGLNAAPEIGSRVAISA
jgi:hypothetical protein